MMFQGQISAKKDRWEVSRETEMNWVIGDPQLDPKGLFRQDAHASSSNMDVSQ